MTKTGLYGYACFQMNRVKIALDNATQTKALLLGQGILGRVADVFKEQFSGNRAIVVADKTTFGVAGRDVQNILSNAGIDMDDPYIFDEPDMHAEWKYIERMDDVLSKTDAIAVAVGSGTINDITKLCSHHQERPYMIVGTAASMDGYVAFGASITKDGAKQTFGCAAPRAVVADVNVVATAPEAMTASGYGDLYAKVACGADWIVADLIGNEPIDPLSWGIVQGGLRDALADPAGAKAGNPQALTRLIEGLCLGGFALQAYPKTSRPASGAEHQISHMLNMDHFVMKNGIAPSHGFQVSIGTLLSLSFYEQFLKTDMRKLDINACVASWPSLEKQMAHSRDVFRGTGFEEFCAGEIKAKYVTPEQLRKELTTIRDNWDELKTKLDSQLISVEETVRRFKAVGAPTMPEDIDLKRTQLRDTIRKAQHIRRRYTILDVALRMGKFEEWLDGVFGENGIWRI